MSIKFYNEMGETDHLVKGNWREIVRVMKKVVLLLGVVIFAQNVAAQDTKIGILNAIQALFNSDAARVVQEELEQEFAQDEQRATELTEELTALQEQYQQNEAVMSEDEVRRMNSDAQDLQVQLQLIQERVQTALQEKNQEFVQSMQEELTQAVTDVVAEGGFDLILNTESAPYFAPVLDITARVTAKLNQNSQVINDSLKLGMNNDEGYDYKKDFEERFKPRFRNPVTTGWQLIDDICKGGLGQKELGVVIAPTGAGKSMALVHLGTQALKEGKEPSLDELLREQTEVEMRIPALLPDDYIPDVNTRLSMYKRIASVTSSDELSELKVELIGIV